MLIESGKGTPGISVEMVFHPDGVETSLTWTGWLSEGAFDRTVESLRTMGWAGDDLENVTGLTAEVELVVQNEEYEGNVYPRIAFINRLGGALGAKMTADKAQSFAAAMRSRIRALDAAGGRKPAAKPAQRQVPVHNFQAPPQDLGPEPPPHDDFDVPF